MYVFNMMLALYPELWLFSLHFEQYLQWGRDGIKLSDSDSDSDVSKDQLISFGPFFDDHQDDVAIGNGDFPVFSESYESFPSDLISELLNIWDNLSRKQPTSPYFRYVSRDFFRWFLVNASQNPLIFIDPWC